MSEPRQQKDCYYVAASSEAVYVRVEGLASLNNCTPLLEYLEELHSRELHEFIFDLSSCQGFDSTFMGTLVGLVMNPGKNIGEFASGHLASGHLGESNAADDASSASQSRPRVILLNLTEGHKKILSEVGVDRLVDVCNRAISNPSIKLKRLENRQVSKESHLRKVFKAHENLIQLDAQNKEKFGDFLELVKKELESGG